MEAQTWGKVTDLWPIVNIPYLYASGTLQAVAILSLITGNDTASTYKY